MEIRVQTSGDRHLVHFSDIHPDPDVATSAIKARFWGLTSDKLIGLGVIEVRNSSADAVVLELKKLKKDIQTHPERYI